MSDVPYDGCAWGQTNDYADCAWLGGRPSTYARFRETAEVINGLPFCDVHADAVEANGEPPWLRVELVQQAVLHGDNVKYLAFFNGREVGAIGAFSNYVVEVEGNDEADATLRLYKTHENISQLRLERIEGVRRFLDLSTRHLPVECVPPDQFDAVVAHDIGEYGWFLWVPDDITEWFAMNAGDEPPAEILRIMEYARNRDCDYVLLDRDAPVNADLPTWEW